MIEWAAYYEQEGGTQDRLTEQTALIAHTIACAPAYHAELQRRGRCRPLSDFLPRPGPPPAEILHAKLSTFAKAFGNR